MELVVKAKHFKGTDFSDNCNCAMSKAAKDKFKTEDVREGVLKIKIDGNNYSHPTYDCYAFSDDREKAESLNYSDEVIRTIELTPIN